jgi:uncharacterized membrane protein
MNKEIATMSSYKEDLAKSFHQQFAENQNNHQSGFIQLLSVLLTVIIGFGVALVNFGKPHVANKINLTLFDFTLAFSIAEGILTLGFFLVVNYAYSFRRDQLVNSTIREKAKITESTAADEWKIFPDSFNPRLNFEKKLSENRKCMIIWWMPDFYAIFSITFLILQTFIGIVYLFKTYSENLLFINSTIDWQAFLISIFGIAFLTITIAGLINYYQKLKELYKQPAHNSPS